MIRTRDFVLLTFATLVVAMLLLASFAHQIYVSRQNADIPLTVPSEREHIAYTPTREDTRMSTLDRLREKLQSGAETIPTISEAPREETIAENVRVRTISACGGSEDGEALALRWPLHGLVIEEQEGARVVSEMVVTFAASTTSSSSAPLITKVPRAILPLYPYPSAVTNCLPSSAIGVTPDGSLIMNDEARRFAQVSSHTLVGYARDGYPIYGTASEASLDSCGGTDSSGSYRYYLSEKSSEYGIITCFHGTPGTFSVE